SRGCRRQVAPFGEGGGTAVGGLLRCASTRTQVRHPRGRPNRGQRAVHVSPEDTRRLPHSPTRPPSRRAPHCHRRHAEHRLGRQVRREGNQTYAGRKFHRHPERRSPFLL